VTSELPLVPKLQLDIVTLQKDRSSPQCPRGGAVLTCVLRLSLGIRRGGLAQFGPCGKYTNVLYCVGFAYEH